MTTREDAAAEVDAKMKAFRESALDGACSTCGAALERSTDPDAREQYRAALGIESAPDSVSLISHADDCAVQAGLLEALVVAKAWGFEFRLKLDQLPDGSYFTGGFERIPD
jgi:hypothetical protein